MPTFSNLPPACESRAAAARVSVDGRRLRGRAITFRSLSHVLMHPRIGPFREQVLPAAVDRTLHDLSDVKALWDHDTREVLGARRSGTLLLTKAATGLDVDIDPPSWAAKYVETIARGDVDGMSFQFLVPEASGEAWDFDTGDGIPVRSLSDILIREITITPFPAYPETSVTVSERSLAAFFADRPPAYNWRRRYQEIVSGGLCD
jgi:HK97 family phage prohead protease